MHLNSMHVLMLVVAGAVAWWLLRRSTSRTPFPKSKSATFTLLTASAGSFATLFVESCEPWDQTGILATLLFGLVPMLPFMLFVAAAALATNAKVELAVSIVTALLVATNAAAYFHAYLIVKDDYASLTILMLFPVNLLIALWLLVTVLWNRGKPAHETAT